MQKYHPPEKKLVTEVTIAQKYNYNKHRELKIFRLIKKDDFY